MESQEIITVQLGTAANFIGAHWWNIQDSFAGDSKFLHDKAHMGNGVLFRSRVTFEGKTVFTPRLIAVDFRDSVGCRDLTGKVQSSEKNKPAKCWDGEYKIQERPANRKNPFLQDFDKELERGRDGATENSYYELDSTVQQWTDIVRVPYHSQSLTLLPSLHTQREVSRFEDGLALLDSVDTREVLEDKVRRFAEETNSLQGFHLLYDWHSSFSGVCSWIKEHLWDEYTRKSILSVPIVAADSSLDESWKRTLSWNLAMDIARSDWSNSLCLPLSLLKDIWQPNKAYTTLPFLSYKPELLYHTTAILASGLEAATSPWTLQTDATILPDLVQHLKQTGSWMSTLYCCLPLEANQESLAAFLARMAEKGQRIPSHCFSPNAEIAQNDCTSSWFSFRGTTSLDFNSDLSSTHNYRRLTTPNELLYEFIKGTCTNFRLHVDGHPVETKSPFPNLFSPYVDCRGLITNRRRAEKTVVKSVPVLSELRSSAEENHLLTTLVTQLDKLTHATLKVDRDLFNEVLETIRNISVDQ